MTRRWKWSMKWGTVLRNSIDVYSCGPRTMFAGTRTTSAIYPSIVTARWVSVPLISTRRTALHVAPVRRVYRVSVLQQRNPVDHCHTVLSFIHSLPVSLSLFLFLLSFSLCVFVSLRLLLPGLLPHVDIAVRGHLGLRRFRSRSSML